MHKFLDLHNDKGLKQKRMKALLPASDPLLELSMALSDESVICIDTAKRHLY